MKTWTGLEAVVFDLDDTLYAERDFVRSGFEAVAVWGEGALGLDAAESLEEMLAIFEQEGSGRVFNAWLAAHDLPLEPWLGQAIEVYRGHRPKIRPFPDAVPALERLSGKFRLGLVTEGPARAQRNKLEALGLGDFFEAVVILGFEDRERWKPDPYPFGLLLERMGLEGEQALYVGDNPAKDFKGARAAGMGAVRLRRPEGLHFQAEPQTADYAPDVEVESLSALGDLLLDTASRG